MKSPNARIYRPVDREVIRQMESLPEYQDNGRLVRTSANGCRQGESRVRLKVGKCVEDD